MYILSASRFEGQSEKPKLCVHRERPFLSRALSALFASARVKAPSPDIVRGFKRPFFSSSASSSLRSENGLRSSNVGCVVRSVRRCCFALPRSTTPLCSPSSRPLPCTVLHPAERQRQLKDPDLSGDENNSHFNALSPSVLSFNDPSSNTTVFRTFFCFCFLLFFEGVKLVGLEQLARRLSNCADNRLYESCKFASIGHTQQINSSDGNSASN